MDVSRDRVIVIANTLGDPAEVYHREFPEIRALGHDPVEAVGVLALELERALDTALTHWRQEVLRQAIAEVEVFHAMMPRV